MPPPPKRLTPENITKFCDSLRTTLEFYRASGVNLRIMQVIGNAFPRDPYSMEDAQAAQVMMDASIAAMHHFEAKQAEEC